MTEVAHKRMNANESIAWAMEQPRGRFELVGSEVVAMAPESSIHARAKGCFARPLDEEVERLGLDSTVYPDGMAAV
jgi:Uma2 family endonuclease